MNVNRLPKRQPETGGRLSIIMPVRDGQRYIRTALESVACQCADADELIVIDDASTDQTVEIVKAFSAPCRVHLLKGAGKGPAAARNLGLARATGRLITFLDHDDYWPKKRIQSHLDCLEAQPSVDIAMGRVEYFLSPDSARQNETRMLSEAVYGVNLGASTFRREVFENVGLFDERMRFSEDHDLFLRIREAGCQILPIDDIGLYYRIHDTNMTRGKSPQEMQFFEAIHKSLSRRRAQRQALSAFPKNRIRDA